MKKYKIIAVMGQAGAGKDSFVNTLLEDTRFKDIAKPIISCTTRPIREHEQDGVNYHYLTNEEFAEQVVNGEMLEATVFNNWCYGTSTKNLDEDALNIGVFNPEGVEILQGSNNIDLTVVYILANDKVRLLRQLNREENPDCNEIVRRFGADKKDFRQERIDAINPDYKILNNGDKTIDLLAQEFATAYAIG
jgi:guanylate kinase